MFPKIFTMAAVCLMAAGSVSSANLVFNGSFEDRIIYDAYYGFAGGDTLDSWTVEGDSVDIVRDYWQPADGLQSVDLSGNWPGGISQSVQNTSGANYILSFALAANPDEPSPKTAEIWWGNNKLDTLTVSPIGHSRSNMGWTYHAYIVTGSGNDLLRFVSLGGPSCYGPALDDVSVVPVPEPASISVLLTSLSLSAAITCHRRR